MTITYRQATSDDYDLTFKIKSDSLKPYIEQTWGWDTDVQLKYHLDNFKPPHALLIMYEGEMVGYVEFVETEQAVELKNILIDNKYQSRGIGTFVITGFIDDTTKKGKVLTLEVLGVNSRAKKLYELLGFSVIGERDKKILMVYHPRDHVT